MKNASKPNDIFFRNGLDPLEKGDFAYYILEEGNMLVTFILLICLIGVYIYTYTSGCAFVK